MDRGAGQPVLGVDYGSVVTLAVLGWPDGTWRAVPVDGAPVVSSAVAAGEDGQLLVGQAALARLAGAPQTGMVEPKRWLRPEPAADAAGCNGWDSPAVDAAAATLARLAAAATEVLGQKPEQVRLVVPATWGPRRRTLLRRAVHQADLSEPQLVLAPVGVAEFLVAAGQPIPAGSWLVIADVGSGLEVTALARLGDGWEVLAAHEADAGGRAVDAAIVTWLDSLPGVGAGAPPDLAGAPGDGPLDSVEKLGRTDAGVAESAEDPTIAAATVGVPAASAETAGGDGPAPVPLDVDAEALLARSRVAKEMLATAPAVAVTSRHGMPVVLSHEQMGRLTAPVFAAAAGTVRQVMEAADTDLARCAGVFLVGAGAAQSGLPQALAGQLPVPVSAVHQAKHAAVLGAVRATRPASAPLPPAVQAPPRRRALTIIAPFLVSLALLWQVMTTAYFGSRLPVFRGYDYVLANEGELALAALFTQLGVLTHALTWAVAILARAGDDDRPPGVPEQGWQIATGLLAAVAIGVSVAAVYGWVVGLGFEMPSGPYVRWAILPLLPLIGCIVAAARLALRSPIPPDGGWHNWLAFPFGSMLFAAAGMLLLQATFTFSLWLVPRSIPGYDLIYAVAGRVGAALFAVGLVTALTARRRLQLIASPPVIVFCVVLMDPFTVNAFAVIYALAVTAGYTGRLWRYGLLQRQHQRREPTAVETGAAPPPGWQPVPPPPNPTTATPWPASPLPPTVGPLQQWTAPSQANSAAPPGWPTSTGAPPTADAPRGSAPPHWSRPAPPEPPQPGQR